MRTPTGFQRLTNPGGRSVTVIYDETGCAYEFDSTAPMGDLTPRSDMTVDYRVAVLERFPGVEQPTGWMVRVFAGLLLGGPE